LPRSSENIDRKSVLKALLFCGTRSKWRKALLQLQAQRRLKAKVKSKNIPIAFLLSDLEVPLWLCSFSMDMIYAI
jgi:hypothetical protein